MVRNNRKPLISCELKSEGQQLADLCSTLVFAASAFEFKAMKTPPETQEDVTTCKEFFNNVGNLLEDVGCDFINTDFIRNMNKVCKRR